MITEVSITKGRRAHVIAEKEVPSGSFYLFNDVLYQAGQYGSLSVGIAVPSGWVKARGSDALVEIVPVVSITFGTNS